MAKRKSSGIVPQKREPNGRLSRAGARGHIEPATIVVLKQPHRMGKASERRSCAAGRLIEDSPDLMAGMSKNALYQAATKYSEIDDARKAIDGTRLGSSNSSATGVEMDEATILKIKRAFNALTHELQCMGYKIRIALETICIDKQEETWVPDSVTQSFCIDGLVWLCKYFEFEYMGEDKEQKPQRRAA